MSVRSNKRKAQVLQQELGRLNKELDGFDRALKNKSTTPAEVQKIRDAVIYKKRRITEIEDILTRPDVAKEKTPEQKKADAKDRARATADARKSAETGTGLKDGNRVPKGKKFSSQIVARDGFINLDMVAAAQESKEITAERAQKYRDTAKLHNEAIRNQRVVGAVRKPTTQYESKSQAERIIRAVDASGVQPSIPAGGRTVARPAVQQPRLREDLKRIKEPTPAELKQYEGKNAKMAPKEYIGPAGPPAAPAEPKRAPRAKKATVAPEKPVEVVKAEAKKAVAKKAAPRKAAAKKVAVEPVKPSAVGKEIPLSTKAGTGNQPAGPKRPTIQKLVAAEKKALASRPGPAPRHQYEGKPKVEPKKVTKPNAAQRAKIRKAADAVELEQTRAIAKKAITDKVGKAPGAVRAKVAAPKQSARVTGAMGKVDTGAGAKAAGSIRKGMASAERLAKLKTAAVKGLRGLGEKANVAGAAYGMYEMTKAQRESVQKDMSKAQALLDAKYAPKRGTGNLKGSVRGHGTGGALQKAKKAPVSVPNVPRSPSIKTGKKASQKPAVGVLGASTHVVKRGDTLWDIAKDNKTTVGSLLKANPTIAERRAKGQTSIFSGTKVRIPKGK